MRFPDAPCPSRPSGDRRPSRPRHPARRSPSWVRIPLPLTVLPGKFPILPPHMHIDPEDPNVACRLCRRRRFSTGSQTRPTRISFHSPGDIELTWPLQRAGEGSVNSASTLGHGSRQPSRIPSTLRQLSVNSAATLHQRFRAGRRRRPRILPTDRRSRTKRYGVRVIGVPATLRQL